MSAPSDLPIEIVDLAEFGPLEDLLLAILRDGITSVPVYSLIPDDAPPLFILVRRIPNLGPWGGDDRFIDVGSFAVHVYATDPDGDEKGAIVSEAVRVVLRNAWRERKSFPGLGRIARVTMLKEPVRKTDWATSSGPVQFADLPTGMWRYEASYQIAVRYPAAF